MTSNINNNQRNKNGKAKKYCLTLRSMKFIGIIFRYSFPTSQATLRSQSKDQLVSALYYVYSYRTIHEPFKYETVSV